MQALVARLARDTTGQDLIEYGLLAALISVVAVAAITSLGTTLAAAYADIRNRVPSI